MNKLLTSWLAIFALLFIVVDSQKTRSLTQITNLMAVYADSPEDTTPDKKVLFELYYQSMCPYCHKFITRTLKQVLQTPEITKIAEFRMVPYGNAKSSRRGNDYRFKCQHGDQECLGNIVHGCALKHLNFETHAFPFIVCLENSDKDWFVDGESCAKTLGIDWNTIFRCSTGNSGLEQHFMNGLLTETVPLDGVPFSMIDGEIFEDQNLVGELCGRYKGPQRIKSCLQ